MHTSEMLRHSELPVAHYDIIVICTINSRVVKLRINIDRVVLILGSTYMAGAVYLPHFLDELVPDLDFLKYS